MANTASNVTAAKPSASGAIWMVPLGTTLPTDTTTDMSTVTGAKCLGYCSSDGVTNSTNLESETIKAWGGDTVLTIQTSKDDTFKFTLLESTNTDVLAFVNGSANVTGALATGVTVTVNNKDVEEQSIVIDMLLRDNTAKRVVIPDCKISEIGDVTYSDSDATGYEVTLTCMPDSSGNTHYEYLLAAASA